MESSEICFLSIAEASALIASKELSPVEVTKAHFQRIEAIGGKLNAFITLLKDEALASAQQAESAIQSGDYIGPLHGIPIGLKDLYYTKGIRTTIGSKILRDFVPDYDAAVTEKFREAGAILMGKLQMHEFALGATSENPHDGPARNPWNTECVTGGSSGGSGAAVSAGLCMGALGSDTGGSIRIPSALCGITGLKPTFGRVSRYGVYPLSWSLDTVGPMTRTVRDAALVMNAIAGYDERDPSSANVPMEDFSAKLGEDINGVRVGVPQEFFYDVIDPEVKAAVQEAAKTLQSLGASVDEASMPMLDYSLNISGTLLVAEAAEVHLDHLRNQADDIGADVRGRLQLGALTTAMDYIKAQRARTAFNAQMIEVFTRYDILIAPAIPIGASKIGESMAAVGEEQVPALALLSRLTRPFNISGVPTASVPCGFTSAGLPIGLQIAGRAFEDSTVLKVAHAFEQATDWGNRRPPV